MARRFVLAALIPLLVLAMAPVAEAKKPKCKAYAEKKGCALKGGVFAKSYTAGKPGVKVGTGRRTAFSIGGDILCPGYNQTWWFHINSQGHKRLKVGKTTALSGSSSNTGVTGTIKVLSAKKALLKLTVSPAPCKATYNVTLKRRKKAPKLPRPSTEGATPGQIFYV